MNEYKGKIFRLAGRKGGDFEKMEIHGMNWKGHEKAINFYVEVVGFSDTSNEKRSWGVRFVGEKIGTIERIKNYFKKYER